jgi:membrane-bound ClpP family serine protease
VVSVRKNRQAAAPYILISIALFEVGSVFIYPSEVWWIPAVNPLLALVVVVLTGGYLWLIMRAAYQSVNEPPAQDLDSLIGKVGEARTEIHTSGTVYVGGELWSAASDDVIPDGKMVKVIGREGMTLKVVSTEA